MKHSAKCQTTWTFVPGEQKKLIPFPIDANAPSSHFSRFILIPIFDSYLFIYLLNQIALKVKFFIKKFFLIERMAKMAIIY
jgi:hypothetical protein